MRQPESLASLVDQGIIQEVVRPLMSGKEAQIYLVVSGDELRVAKVYRAAQHRNFRQRAEYTEGRVERNSRTQRAMGKRSRYGRAQDEASWRSAEVDIIYRLRAAGVRVPEPHCFSDGVLVMELIADADGAPAPRLADVVLGRDEAGAVFATLLSSVVKMLCAGVVHSDLSEFNVLMGQDGPVLIDFPQAIDPARNQNARKLLVRDVDNLSQFLVRFAPGQRRLPYGQELWELYARSELTPATQLTGRYRPPKRKADTSAVLREIEDVAHEAQQRRDSRGPSRRRGRRPKPVPRGAPVVEVKTAKPIPRGAPIVAVKTPKPARDPVTRGRDRAPAVAGSGPEAKPAPPGAGRRRRRRRRRGGGGGQAPA